jgi:hypothetical protein
MPEDFGDAPPPSPAARSDADEVLSARPARRGDWMQIYSGRQFWPLDPRPEEVDILDIAHALSHLCRFAGHVTRFYSVGDHCVRVSRLAPAHDRMIALAGLLHDATEAYVVDVPRPLKRFLPGYAEIEARVARCVEARFDLETGILDHPAVKTWDEVLLATEARDLMGGETGGKWHLRAQPLPEIIVPRTPEEARAAFLERFEELGGRR